MEADFIELEKALGNSVSHRHALPRGAFLESLELLDAPDFERWREQKAAVLDAKFRDYFTTQIRAALDDDRALHAELLASEAIERFPDEIPLRLAKIAAQLQQSKMDAARSTFVELHAHAGSDRLSDVPSFDDLVKTSPRVPALTSRQPFVGRRSEIGLINESWRRACGGIGGLILVRGAPGMGKTALCLHCAQLFRNARVLKATAYEPEQRIGFSMLAELFRSQITDQDVERLSPVMQVALQHLVPGLAIDLKPELVPTLGHEASERRLFDAAVQAIIALSSESPVLVVLDDLQWIDDSSRAWLEYLSRNILNQRVLVLGACRDGFTIGSSLNWTTQIELSELDQAEIHALIKEVTDTVPDHELATEVFRLTSGHPFYAAAVAARLSKGLSVEVPLVNRQVEMLSTVNRRLVGMLATIGAPVSVKDLAALSSLSLGEITDRLKEMPTLVKVHGIGTVGIAHDLVKASIYNRLDDPTRIAFHEAIARFFEDDQHSVALAAEHWSKAGNRDKTARLAIQAARDSEVKHAAAGASRFYQLALSNVSAPDAARRIKQRLAKLLFASSRFDDAIPYLRELADSEHSESDEVSWRWKHLFSRVASSHCDAYELLAEANRLEEQARRVGHPEALYQSLRAQVIVECRRLSDHTLGRQRKALLELSEQHPETRVGTMACRLAADHIAGTEDAFKGLAHADTALRWAERIGEPELLIECLRSVAMTQYFCGRVREARTTMHSALGVVEQSGAVLYESLILPKLISIVVELDARKETEQLIERVEQLDAQRDWNDLAMALANRAVLLYHNGEFVQCVDVCKASAAASKAGSWLEIGVRGVLGLCLLEIGSMHEAVRQADHLKILLSTTDVIHGDISYPLMLIARIAGLQRTERDVEELIRRKHQQYAKRDYVCRSRIQLALGETIARRASTESWALISEIVQESEARGLKALLEQGNATMRRIGRRTGVPRAANARLHSRSFA